MPWLTSWAWAINRQSIGNVCFEGVCLNSRHPSPRRERSGVGRCGPSANSRRSAESGESAGECRQASFYAQASQTLQIYSEKDVHFRRKSQEAPLGSPRCPKGTHRHPKGAKGSQSQPKESKMSSKDTQRRPTNHKTIYT